jgi:hypothetical protein
VIQFIRKTGPENHTNEAKQRTKHTQSTQQAHTLSSHRPRRRVNGTQDLKTVVFITIFIVDSTLCVVSYKVSFIRLWTSFALGYVMLW